MKNDNSKRGPRFVTNTIRSKNSCYQDIPHHACTLYSQILHERKSPTHCTKRQRNMIFLRKGRPACGWTRSNIQKHKIYTLGRFLKCIHCEKWQLQRRTPICHQYHPIRKFLLWARPTSPMHHMKLNSTRINITNTLYRRAKIHDFPAHKFPGLWPDSTNYWSP